MPSLPWIPRILIAAIVGSLLLIVLALNSCAALPGQTRTEATLEQTQVNAEKVAEMAKAVEAVPGLGQIAAIAGTIASAVAGVAAMTLNAWRNATRRKTLEHVVHEVIPEVVRTEAKNGHA